MADEDYLEKVAKKFNISRESAHYVALFLQKQGVPVDSSKAGVLISHAKDIAQRDKIPMGWAMQRSEREYEANAVIGRKRVGTKDRKDTQSIEKKFADEMPLIPPSGKKQFKPGVDGELRGFRVTEVGKRNYTNILGDDRNEKRSPNTKVYMPVYKHQEGEIKSRRPLPRPKYYYYGVNEEFNYWGNEDPPKNDPDYRSDRAKFIPYIQVETLFERLASKYPVPAYNIDALGNKIPLQSNGQIVYGKDHGEKILKFNFYVGDTFIKTQPIRTDFEDDVKFNKLMGQKIALIVKALLDQFKNEYGSSSKHKYEQDIKKRKMGEELKDYYGVTSPKILNFMNLVQKKADAIKAQKDQEALPEPKWRKVDGKYTKIERKKGIKKVKVARKKIIKRKITKKPIKRCICKKKIVRRVKK